jgi:FAD/FMN-containing dehydrogenase
VPLGYPASASVVSTYIERVPLLTGPKMLLSEGWQSILNMHLLLANGMPLDTGTANWCKNRPNFLPSGAPGGPDLSRLFSGSQGTLGITTNLIIKAKYLPKNKKILFSEFEDLKKCLNSIRKILWFDKAREILIISKKNLALILSENIDDEKIEKIKSVCPNWLLVMGIEFDEDEKYEIDLKDIHDFGLKIEEDLKINGVNLQELFLEEFKLPNNLNNFREYKKALHIPFYINGDKILDLNSNVKSILEEFDYPFEDLVGYIMPMEQGHTYYMDYTIHYEHETNSKSDLENIKKFFAHISEYILDNGGVIDRPYGIWADMIFSKNPNLFGFLKQIKIQLDPNNILNPGRMGL